MSAPRPPNEPLEPISRRTRAALKTHAHLQTVFALLELASLIAGVTLLYWRVQSNRPVVELIEPPQVTALTPTYAEVRWHTRLIQDCPTVVYPTIHGVSDSYPLPPYLPAYSRPTPKVLLRRYPLPALPDGSGDLELRLLLIARCNPLWWNQQWIEVPLLAPPEPATSQPLP